MSIVSPSVGAALHPWNILKDEFRESQVYTSDHKGNKVVTVIVTTMRDN